MEEQKGIVRFVNEFNPGFDGIIKHRYSDFVVHEISHDGSVAVLGSVASHVSSSKPEKDEESSWQLPNLADVEALFPVSQKQMAAQILGQFEESDGKNVDLCTDPLVEKSMRTTIHQGIRSLFQGQLLTDVMSADSSSIRIYSKGISSSSNDARNRQRGTTSSLPLLRFALYKENIGTMEALQILSRRLHINIKNFSYAGTKDRRGITTQFVVARHCTPAMILGANKLYGRPNVLQESSSGNASFGNGQPFLAVSDVTEVSDPLRLGDLSGNRFGLIIRHISSAVSSDEIQAAIESLSTHGFINYFGLQRFGTGSISTDRIGAALLMEDWSKAVDLILSGDGSDSDNRIAEARQFWKNTKDPKSTLSMMPHSCVAERSILQHFVKMGNVNDYQGAVKAIPRDLRSMYVHAVQSLLWNLAASARIAASGLTVQIGDLFESESSIERVDESNHSLVSIDKVVLCVPGYDTDFEDLQQFSPFIASIFDGKLSVETFIEACRPSTRGLWDLSGTHRCLIVVPGKVQYAIGYYSDPDEDLSLEILKSRSQVEDGSYRALAVSFSLPCSSYATVALYELMHQSTHHSHQRTLNHKRVKVD